VAKKSETGLFVKFAVIVCVLGLFLVLTLVLQPESHKMYPSFSKVLIGSLYSLLCLAGIFAVFYPKNCEGAFIFKARPPEKESELADFEKIRFSGHHPACEYFSPNRLKIGETTFCASCAGLLVGALAALAGAIFYFFVGFMPPVGLPVLLVGYACLFFGLSQFRLGGYVKLAANALFVFGSFLTLMAVDGLRANLLIDLYAFGLIVFLLITRIYISQWNNKRICAKCSSCLWRA
jgi:hypothetical protein